MRGGERKTTKNGEKEPKKNGRGRWTLFVTRQDSK